VNPRWEYGQLSVLGGVQQVAILAHVFENLAWLEVNRPFHTFFVPCEKPKFGKLGATT
jgi:hypothetical protein